MQVSKKPYFFNQGKDYIWPFKQSKTVWQIYWNCITIRNYDQCPPYPRLLYLVHEFSWLYEHCVMSCIDFAFCFYVFQTVKTIVYCYFGTKVFWRVTCLNKWVGTALALVFLRYSSHLKLSVGIPTCNQRESSSRYFSSYSPSSVHLEKEFSSVFHLVLSLLRALRERIVFCILASPLLH